MRRFRTLVLASMLLLVALPLEAAQSANPPTTGKVLVATDGQARTVVLNDQDARALRREFLEVMKKYPPSLGAILRLDPTLMSNPTYLAPYPALQAFLTAHPDVQKNPGYFLESYSDGAYYDSRTWSAGERIWTSILDFVGAFTVFVVVVAVVTWLIRTLVDYRRWKQLAKVQADAHTKLLDRLTSNEELVAYMHTPAGAQFLQSAPIALDPGARRIGAPVSRILWSGQAGLVLMMAGFALQYVSGRIDPEAQQPVFSIGVVALAIGVGFLLSAGLAYLLSHRLGLFEPPAGASPLGAASTGTRHGGPGA
jgi:uncharacterized membrane protein YjfL (UPF0719 family)